MLYRGCFNPLFKKPGAAGTIIAIIVAFLKYSMARSDKPGEATPPGEKPDNLQL
jgi:hypothetical protein